MPKLAGAVAGASAVGVAVGDGSVVDVGGGLVGEDFRVGVGVLVGVRVSVAVRLGICVAVGVAVDGPIASGVGVDSSVLVGSDCAMGDGVGVRVDNAPTARRPASTVEKPRHRIQQLTMIASHSGKVSFQTVTGRLRSLVPPCASGLVARGLGPSLLV